MTASILYAWEFGAGLGHVGAFLPLGRALRDDGHRVEWAVVHTTAAARLLSPEGFRWFQAPSFTEAARPGPPLSYADILLRFGYASPDDLRGLTGAWRSLMQATGAELVLADHAPTAVLAARTLDIPVMLFSNGFTVPPHVRPLPNMRPWQPIPEAPLLALEDAALTSVNAVLADFGRPPLDALCRLFEVAEETLITFPELDHYDGRGPARYWGSLPSAGGGMPVAWPDIPGPRLFAYLRPECRHHESLLSALHSLGLPAAIYFPDRPAGLRERYTAPHLVYLDRPADLAQMAHEADLAITYSSLATTTAFLFAGKPLLLLPWHLEQFMLARRVGEMGAALVVNPEQPADDLRPPLLRLLNEPSFRDNARAFAAKYADFDQDQVLTNLVRRIEDILSTQKGTAS